MTEHKTIIEPPSRFRLGLTELWQYRELFYIFTWRDIKVKYKQTYLGVIWAVIQPLLLMLLFTFVFSKNLKFDSGNIRYEVFVLSGLIIWGLFSSAVSHGADSIIEHSSMIKKIYFPRMVIPVAALLVAGFDFIIALILFFIFCLFLQQQVHILILVLLPAAVLLTAISALGIGLLLSAFTVYFRDFRYALPFLMQFLFFASAVVYSIHSIQQPWFKMALSINPVNGAIELLRGALGHSVDKAVVFTSVISCTVFFVAGVFYFRKVEAYFADLS